MRTNLSRRLIFISVIGNIVFGQVPEAHMKMEQVPSNYSITDSGSIHDIGLHLRASLDWPSEAIVRAKQVSQDDQKVQWAIQDTRRWLSVILQAEWVPKENFIEVLTLKASANGEDAVRMRFKSNANVIQITSTAWRISIAISQPSGLEVSDPRSTEDARLFAVKMIEKFFAYSDKIIAGNNWKLKQTKAGVQASSEMGSDWWKVVDWWTNGTVFVLSAPKLDSTVPRLPPGIPNWFTMSEEEHVLPPLPKR